MVVSIADAKVVREPLFEDQDLALHALESLQLVCFGKLVCGDLNVSR
jgi:hypothetical protein